MLFNIKLVHDAPYTGDRHVDPVGAVLSVIGMGGIVLSILVWQEGGEAVAALLVLGAVGLAALAWWLVRRKRQGKPALIDPALFASKIFRLGIPSQMLQQIALGGMMIALPIYLQMVLEYNAMLVRPVDRAAVAEHVRRRAARREAGRQAPAERHHPVRVRAAVARHAHR